MDLTLSLSRLIYELSILVIRVSSDKFFKYIELISFSFSISNLDGDFLIFSIEK